MNGVVIEITLMKEKLKMKLRILSLALLASMALTTMETQATDAKVQALAQMKQKTQKHKVVKQAGAAAIGLPVGGAGALPGGHDTAEARFNGVKEALGHDAAGGAGDSIFKRIEDVNAKLGAGHPVGGGAAAADTNTKAANLLARLKAIPAGNRAIVAAPAAVSIEDWLAAQGA